MEDRISEIDIEVSSIEWDISQQVRRLIELVGEVRAKEILNELPLAF